jgi:hypothetical protein
MVKKKCYKLTLSLFIAAFAGCVLRSAQTPTDSTEVICFASTGERDYHVDVLVPPPEILHPGESVLVHFTGGYYDVLPSCKMVDGEAIYHYPTVKELSEKPRIVDVYMDDALIHSQECMHDCKLSFSLPDQIQIGSHDLDIRPRSWGYYPRDVTFNIMILR